MEGARTEETCSGFDVEIGGADQLTVLAFHLLTDDVKSPTRELNESSRFLSVIDLVSEVQRRRISGEQR